jgi:3D (Asp-Asp-Asp) domain-containing protein
MVANNCLPFGTRIKIPKLFGEKVFTVHDRMNKRYGCGKFDIWMDAPKKEIFQFGIKRAEVQVFYVKAQKTELARLP